jgi:hypothetical protein
MDIPDRSAGDPRIVEEVGLIMGDLMTAEDDAATIRWTAVPLLEFDPWLRTHPEYLDNGLPRYTVVTLNLASGARSVVADATETPGARDYWIAEVFQDELCNETRELRPLCPVHSGKTPRILVPEISEGGLVWQCNDDRSVRCDLGSYWRWRRSFSLSP